MKNEQTAVIKDMEFLLNELHKEWERPGEVKSTLTSVANTEGDNNSPMSIVILCGVIFIIGSPLWLLYLTTKSVQNNRLCYFF